MKFDIMAPIDYDIMLLLFRFLPAQNILFHAHLFADSLTFYFIANYLWHIGRLF